MAQNYVNTLQVGANASMPTVALCNLWWRESRVGKTKLTLKHTMAEQNHIKILQRGSNQCMKHPERVYIYIYLYVVVESYGAERDNKFREKGYNKTTVEITTKPWTEP